MIGSAFQFTYHSITMTLELEAYVVACFAVALGPVRIVQGFFRKALGSGLRAALEIAAGGAVLCAVMLAGAALYEAVTLILIG